MPQAGAPLLPVSLNLDGKAVLVVGGGPVGARKASSFLEAGARVTGLAPGFGPTWPGGAHQILRPWQSGDGQGFVVVVAATNDAALNRQICAEARAGGAWCNDASAPDASDFHTMAVVRRGAIKIGIGTSGLSPVLAGHLKAKIESAIGPEYGQLQDLATLCRIELQQRAEFWRQVLAGDALDLLRAGKLVEAEGSVRRLAEELRNQEA